MTQLSKAIQSNLNPKFINVFVSGRVKNPGPIKLTKSSTLNDAIDIAGGSKVLKGKTRFVRFLNDGQIDTRKFKYSKRNKTYIAQINIMDKILKSASTVKIGKRFSNKRISLGLSLEETSKILFIKTFSL